MHHHFVLLGQKLAILVAATSLLLTNRSTGAEPAVPAVAFEWQSLEIPRALVVVGVWGDMFQWRKALHQQGIEYQDAYRAQNAYHRPLVQMINMPSTPADYARFSTIVLINVDAPALGQEQLNTIKQFVEQGGGLVVLGGYWAFERGAYAGTPLEEMLPVEIPQQPSVTQVRTGAALTADAFSDWRWEVDFDVQPKAYFFHTLTAKKNANTILHAGDPAVMFAGTFGEGRVIACGLTVNGKPGDGELPFWEWEAWPNVLGQAVEWAGGNRPLQVASNNTVKLTPVDEDEAEKLRLDFQPLSKEVIARFIANPNGPAAGAIFSLVFPENKQQVDLTPELVAALASQAQGEWSAVLEKAADSLNPNLNERKVALELLGATKLSVAANRLLSALEDEDVATGAIAGLQRLNDPSHRGALLRLFERSLASADFKKYELDTVGDASAGVKGRIAVGSAIALYQLGDPKGIERLLYLHRQIRFLRRVFFNAAKRRVVETDPTGVAIRATIYKKAVDFSLLEQELLAAAGPIPASQHEAFIAAATAAEQEDDVLWLAAALRRTPREEGWEPLAQANDGILRRLALGKDGK